MAEVYLVRTVDGFMPWTPQDEEICHRYALGEVYRSSITKPRNPLFHRKFFAMLKIVFDNQDKYTNMDDLLLEVKLKTGHYREHITTKGEIIYQAKSISFENMDDVEFEQFYDMAVDVVLKYFIPMSKETLAEEVTKQVLEFI